LPERVRIPDYQRSSEQIGAAIFGACQQDCRDEGNHIVLAGSRNRYDMRFLFEESEKRARVISPACQY
jgi:hypothetical protein